MRKISQAFEVEVLELFDDGSEFTFTGRLRDLTEPNNPEEIATFKFAEVPQADRSKIAVGTVFKWLMASVSEFKFDDTRYTAEDIERAKQEAEKYREILGWT